MYAADRAPRFEAYAAFVQSRLPNHFPYYNKLWRSEYDTQEGGWGGGRKIPTPFIMLGMAEFDKNETDYVAKLDTSPKDGEYAPLKVILEKFVIDLIKGGYLKAKTKKRLGTKAFNEIVKASTILNLQKRAPIFPEAPVTDVLYEVSILSAVFMKYMNKKAIIESSPSDAGQYAEIAANQKKQEKLRKDKVETPRANTIKQPKSAQSAVPPGAVNLKKEKSKKRGVKVGKNVHDYYYVNYSLGALKDYADTAAKVLVELENRIRAYGIRLEKPLNLNYQIS